MGDRFASIPAWYLNFKQATQANSACPSSEDRRIAYLVLAAAREEERVLCNSGLYMEMVCPLEEGYPSGPS